MDELCYPAMLTDELRDILGRPNFACAPIAHKFRDHGRDIPCKAEAEQAFVIDWMIRLYLTHGDDWRAAGEDELQALGDAA